MLKAIFVAFLIASLSQAGFSQNNMGIGTTNPDPSAILEIQSSSLGILVPRMTTAQRDAISSPATGLLIYNSTTNAFNYYNGGWIAIGTGTGNGTVTTASVVSANGFAGSVANASTTPAITLSTSVSGLLKGNGTAISAADGSDYVIPNSAITGATKTKITYDSKGLVTAGANATTADIAASTDKNYVTDAQLTVIGNTSGTNTGDQNLSGLGGVAANSAITGATKTKITYDAKGLVTAGADVTTADIASSSDKRYVTDAQLTVIGNTSGTNTGDQNLSGLGGVAANTAITGATKTKITYDAKGLVTAGANATTADIAASTDKNYVTDAQLTIIGNTSGTNTGDKSLSDLGGIVANSAITGATKTKITYDAKGLVTAGADATTADIASSSDKRYVTDAQLTLIGNTSGTNTGDQTLSGLGGVAANSAITSATKTKITYDAKGLVTAGADATTADIAASTDKNYVSDAQLTVIGNTSGTNTGDKYLSDLGGVAANSAITGATKTKVTYDAKGLVTAGADATTADIASSADKRYVTDAQLTLIGNTSGTNTGDQTLSGLGGVAANTAITGATKTKITYDAKGLVTAGADATTADIASSADKRYVTDAQLTVIGNTSGSNTGDQTNISGTAGNVTGTVAVANGGTGIATTTAYGVITGGTTSTGAFQNAGAGTSGQILTSNGASALPSWKSGVTLSTVENDLTSNVTMTNEDTWYDGASGSLTVGTWLIIATINVANDVSNVDFHTSFKLWDGTNVESSAEVGPAKYNTSGYLGNVSVTLSGIVTVASTTTWRISAAWSSAAAAAPVPSILATVNHNSVNNKAGTFKAVKIGN